MMKLYKVLKGGYGYQVGATVQLTDAAAEKLLDQKVVEDLKSDPANKQAISPASKRAKNSGKEE